MKKTLPKLLAFQTLLRKYNGVKRDISSLHDAKLADNDVEHSYRVAMLAWMIAEEYKLKLDHGKILKYALVHDLPEVHAGDLSLYANYRQETKEKNEAKAIKRMMKDFPKQKSIWAALHEYEKRRDDESKFVYMIEKLEPILVVLVGEKDHWKKRGIGFDDFAARKQRKIASIDSFAQVFNREMMEFLKRHKKRYFAA